MAEINSRNNISIFLSPLSEVNKLITRMGESVTRGSNTRPRDVLKYIEIKYSHLDALEFDSPRDPASLHDVGDGFSLLTESQRDPSSRGALVAYSRPAIASNGWKSK